MSKESVSYKDVGAFTGRKIFRLLNNEGDSAVRADLAQLRRGIGKLPGEDADLWPLVFEDMPEAMYSRNGVPTYAEWAVYHAVTLFALHQQGKDRKRQPMHEKGISLGAAVRRLVSSPDDEARIIRRFNKVLTARTPKETAYHLRGLVELLKSAAIPLDYARLAGDLYCLQIPSLRERIQLAWGQDFYRIPQKKENSIDDNTSLNPKE